MSDRYIDFVNSPFGQLVAKNLGLPNPMPLDRFDANAPVVKGTVLLGAANGGDLTDAIAKVLSNINAETLAFSDSGVQEAAASVGLNAQAYAPSAEDTQKFKALVFDASGIKTSAELKALHSFFGPVIRKMSGSGRIIVIGRTPELLDDAKYTTAQRALEGFTRAIGKEVKKAAPHSWSMLHQVPMPTWNRHCASLSRQNQLMFLAKWCACKPLPSSVKHQTGHNH